LPSRIKDDYGLLLPDLKKMIQLHENIIGLFRETKVVAVGLNSVGMSDEQSREEAERISQSTGLPAIDAFRFGPQLLTDAILGYFNLKKN
jgi:uncharacterized NAD-dependent epimerase/dehydratase family protein